MMQKLEPTLVGLKLRKIGHVERVMIYLYRDKNSTEAERINDKMLAIQPRM